MVAPLDDRESGHPTSPDTESGRTVGTCRPGGDETILVAEDDELLRRATVHVLRKAGYQVLVAADGEEAVEVFTANADQISLVLLDVAMPRMGGQEVQEQIAAVRPDVPVLFASGDASASLRRRLGQGALLIQKPYNSSRLLCRVREVLDGE